MSALPHVNGSWGVLGQSIFPFLELLLDVRLIFLSSRFKALCRVKSSVNLQFFPATTNLGNCSVLGSSRCSTTSTPVRIQMFMSLPIWIACSRYEFLSSRSSFNARQQSGQSNLASGHPGGRYGPR